MATTTLGTGSRGREVSVALAGLAAATALIAFAFLAVPDPDLGGELALSRLGSRAADAVVEAWDRLLHSESLPGTRGEAWEWTEEAPLDPVKSAEPRELPVPPGTASAFGALLAAAEEADLREGDAPRAAALLVDALEKAPDAAGEWLARGRLLALLVGAGHREGAHEQWEHLRAGLRGDEAVDGVSSLLRSGLRMAPMLEGNARADLARLLVDRWLAGDLALPAAHPKIQSRRGSVQLMTSLSWQLLFDHLRDIAPPVERARLDAHRDRLQLLVLRERLGELPVAPRERWRLLTIPGLVTPAGPHLAMRRLGDQVRTSLLDADAFFATLRSRLTPERLGGDDLVLELEGDTPIGERIRRPERLPGSDRAFAIRHSDPKAPRREEARRLMLLRSGFVVLGVLVALTTLLAARALARERRLHVLRTAFVASASHELRTPVASLLLLSENLVTDKVTDAESKRRTVDWIHREAKRLRRLVDDLLDFSRLERGRSPELRIEPTPTARLVTDLEQALAERAGTADTFRTSGIEGTLAIDAEAFRRAALNLIDNAVRHGAEDGRVEVDLDVDEQELVLRVRDFGPGIAPQDRESVFAPFWTGAGNGNGSTGTGLGLAIAREIARAHGGDVVLREPADGPGALFELRVPLRASEGNPT